ncbi:MAG TPA: hypothetical protein VFC09_00295 [Candidatus Dormibacteraeota bacterium]|nr:hypothetical protein [Candidatus Dormibacteraeota bacterium]
MSLPREVAAAGCATLLLVACGGGTPAPSPTVVAGTPTVVAVALTVTLTGEPTRTFGGGHWRVCDSGTVHNGSTLTARDVRVVVTYLDHGAVDGQTTRADAPGDGGALGDIPPGESRPFTVCGFARNEPDNDVVSAAPAS